MKNCFGILFVVSLSSVHVFSQLLGGGNYDSKPDPCKRENTCESCVNIKINTHIVGNNRDTCVWEVTTSGHRCVKKYVPSQEISDVAFNPEGCPVISTTATSAPTTTPNHVWKWRPDPHVSTTEKSAEQKVSCDGQNTCESCLSMRLQNRGRCVWKRDERACSTRMKFALYVSSFDTSLADCEKMLNSTATVTPNPQSPDPGHFGTPTESNATGTTVEVFINEIFSVSQIQEKDELDYFGEHVVARIRKIQESNAKMASTVRYEIQKVLFDNEQELLKQNSRRFMLWRNLK